MRRALKAVIINIAVFLPLAFVVAQTEYHSIVEFPKPPGVKLSNGGMTAEDFIKIMYALSISIAGLLAVVKIIYAGVQYMLTDVVTSKAKAKNDIYGAIFGLVIVLSAAFILGTINPQLTQLNFFRGAAPVSVIGPGTRPPPAVAPPNTQVLDLSAPGITQREIDAFTNTCESNGGTVNRTVINSSNNQGLSCASGPSATSEATLDCSGNNCTCQPGSGGVSTCVSKCQTEPPTGTNYLGHTTNSDGSVSCQFSASPSETETRTCSSTPSPISCTPAEVNLGQCTPPPAENVCNTTTELGTGRIYYYLYEDTN